MAYAGYVRLNLMIRNRKSQKENFEQFLRLTAKETREKQ